MYGQSIEIGCGEVKKGSALYDLKVKDKMRVLEIMKRQLHIRLQYARDESEVFALGLGIWGTAAVTCCRMRMDLSRGVCLYLQDDTLTLPTTYDTFAHMDTALETILKLTNDWCISPLLLTNPLTLKKQTAHR